MIVGPYNKTEYSAEKQELAVCLNRLRSPEFSAFARFLKTRLEERSETLSNATDMLLVYRMQGQIRAIKDILETIEADRKVGA